MLNGKTQAAPKPRPKPARARRRTATPTPAASFDAETLAVARAVLEGIQAALDRGPGLPEAPPPTPVQLKDLATAARTAQSVGRLALGVGDDEPTAAVRSIAALLQEIDGRTRGLPTGD